MINNTITEHPYEKRVPLTTAELLSEARGLPQICGISHCVLREGADDIDSVLETLQIPIVHIVKEKISISKRKAKFELERPKQLHQDHSSEMHSMEIVDNNS